MNSVTLIGRLGRDPESKQTPNGKNVTTFSIAVDRGRDQPPDWIGIVCWEKTAEIAQKYLAKGKQVAIQGRIQVQKWEKDGVKRERWEVVAERLELLGSRDDRQGAPERAQEGAPRSERSPEPTQERRTRARPENEASAGKAPDDWRDDDIPF